jgi:hypothetical protein
MKSLAAVATFILLAFSVVTVPATARLDANEALALAKSDRLQFIVTFAIAQSRSGQASTDRAYGTERH